MSKHNKKQTNLEIVMRRVIFLFFLLVSAFMVTCSKNSMYQSLTGKTFVAKISKAQITFTDKRTMVFDWIYENEDVSLELRYSISDDDKIITHLSSSQVIYFPYIVLEFDRSRDLIVAYDKDHQKTIFSIKN